MAGDRGKGVRQVALLWTLSLIATFGLLVYLVWALWHAEAL